jgi:hypothetical protein
MGAFLADNLRMISHTRGAFHARGLAASARATVATLIALVSLAATLPVEAANYPLELISPRAVGTAPASGLAAMPSGHRIFRAYPGLEYNIRAVVIGGAYPFTFALSNAPSGMTVSADGTISWPNPTGTTVTPTLTVTDAEGARVSSAWAINVTTSGFKFVNATSGNDTADGSRTAPWRTLAKVHTSGTNSDIVYFRTGTYTPAGIGRASVGSPWERVEFGSTKPSQWLAYPGEMPVIDFGYVAGVDPSALIRFQASASTPVYLDGLEGRNFRGIGFQIVSGASDYTIIRRLKIHHMILGVDGENPAGIMWTSSYGDSTKYAAVQDSEFYSLNNGGGLKVYSQNRMVIEDNIFRDSGDGFDLKAHVPRFDVRGNTFRNLGHSALFGNMNEGGSGEPASGEWRFNNVNVSGAQYAVDVNQDGQAAAIYIYRNTIVGRAQVRNVDGADGPFRFRNNVIVNSDSGTPAGSHIVQVSVSDPSRITVTDQLTGSPSAGIVDSNGSLTSSFERYVGTHGHQLGLNSAAPMPPADVTVD